MASTFGLSLRWSYIIPHLDTIIQITRLWFCFRIYHLSPVITLTTQASPSNAFMCVWIKVQLKWVMNALGCIAWFGISLISHKIAGHVWWGVSQWVLYGLMHPLKLPSLLAAWLFWTFHNKSHNMKVLVILSQSWSPFLPLTCSYGKKWTVMGLCAALWSIFLRKKLLSDYTCKSHDHDHQWAYLVMAW